MFNQPQSVKGEFQDSRPWGRIPEISNSKELSLQVGCMVIGLRLKVNSKTSKKPILSEMGKNSSDRSILRTFTTLWAETDLDRRFGLRFAFRIKSGKIMTIGKDTGARLIYGRTSWNCSVPLFPGCGLHHEMRTTSSKAHHVLWQAKCLLFYIYASKPVPAGSEAEHSQKKEKEQITSFFKGNE